MNWRKGKSRGNQTLIGELLTNKHTGEQMFLPSYVEDTAKITLVHSYHINTKDWERELVLSEPQENRTVNEWRELIHEGFVNPDTPIWDWKFWWPK